MDENKLNDEVDIFKVLAAIDRKDYGFYDTLSPEQQKKISAFQLTKWVSAVTGNPILQNVYLLSTNFHANMHLVNSVVGKHPKLQWLMLCASSPDRGAQRHQYVPHLSVRNVTLKAAVTPTEAKTYFRKVYPTAAESSLTEIAKEFSGEHRRKVHLGKIYPNLKIADIELLSKLVTDADLKQYERDLGN